MRRTIKELVSIVATTIPVDDPIYEFGSVQVPGQEKFADLRPLFPQKQYIGCDMREGPGVDKVLNLHDIDLPSGCAGMVICLDTLEHVEYPYKAMEEIYRILKPNGMVIISSVMNFPIHDFPYDYWRFTPEAFKSLLKPFHESFVGFAGDKIFPHTVFGIGFKTNKPPLEEFTKKYDSWKGKQQWSLPNIATKITPPILFPLVFYVGRFLIRLFHRNG